MSTTSCSSSHGTIAIPYGILFSNGLYGLLMVVYCIFVTYLLFLQSMRKTVERHDNATTATSKSSTPLESTEKVSNEDPTANGINKSSFTKSSQGKNNTNKTSYRIEQEQTKGQSSEYTRRGMLWSSHASWNLPLAPRLNQYILDPRGLEHILDLLKKYDVDPLRGFLSHQDPLQRLPYARYHLW